MPDPVTLVSQRPIKSSWAELRPEGNTGSQSIKLSFESSVMLCSCVLPFQGGPGTYGTSG